ncbi:MAG: hypothetical protein COB00_17405 [Alcanivorax sp.]|nr:MAG: hypothetical protein COB00_17405 [Alcanivorax sp.]
MSYSSKIESYLKKIDAGQPIDLSNFWALINSLELSLEPSRCDVEARKVKGVLYKVTSIAPELRNELLVMVNEKADDRITAARQNNSHAFSVNGSMLIIREGIMHPQVVLFDQAGQTTHPELKTYSRALLIENRQNFISIEKTLRFLESHCGVCSSDASNLLIVFAEGNAITNVLHRTFLNQFNTLYLLLDVDAGGLQIASNLIDLIPAAEHVFLTPADIEQRLKSVRSSSSPESIERVLRLGRRHHQLAPIAKLIYETRRELEQESYLHG